MLTILTYSYAVGIYASEEIEAAISSDPKLRYLSAGARPGRHDLRRFRRQSKRIIHQALTKVFQSAWEFTLRSVAKIPHTDFEWRDLSRASEHSETESAFLFVQAAEDRIDQAVLWDSMALDD